MLSITPAHMQFVTTPCVTCIVSKLARIAMQLRSQACAAQQCKIVPLEYTDQGARERHCVRRSMPGRTFDRLDHQTAHRWHIPGSVVGQRRSTLAHGRAAASAQSGIDTVCQHNSTVLIWCRCFLSVLHVSPMPCRVSEPQQAFHNFPAADASWAAPDTRRPT